MAALPWQPHPLVGRWRHAARAKGGSWLEGAQARLWVRLSDLLSIGLELPRSQFANPLKGQLGLGSSCRTRALRTRSARPITNICHSSPPWAALASTWIPAITNARIAGFEDSFNIQPQSISTADD